MNDTERPPRIARAKQIGRMAASLLAQPDWAGEVLAVISEVVYLSLFGPDQEILWLAPEGAPLHRRCITASFHSETVKAGLRFTSHGGYLCIGHVLILDVGQASRWEPVAFLHSRRPPLAAVNAHFRNILGVICSLPTGGLGQALELILCPGDGMSDARGIASLDAVWLDRALPSLREIVRACRARDMARVLKSGLKLVGLGPGLTPSGDDYLGGLLFTAHHLQSAFPEDFPWDKGLIPHFLGRARPRTNRLSYTILADLANGHGPEPLHELINSLLRGGPISHSLEDVQRLTGIGHTSGWDILAGVMTAMALTAGV